MDDTLKWIIAIVVILALLGLALLLWTRKNGDRRRAKAKSIRMEARESAAELAERQARAKEAEAAAERARVDADRASHEAQRASRGAEAEHLQANEHRSEVDERLRAADAVDPNVDHRADDYEPDLNRLQHDDPAYREDGTQGFDRGDGGTRR